MSLSPFFSPIINHCRRATDRDVSDERRKEALGKLKHAIRNTAWDLMHLRLREQYIRIDYQMPSQNGKLFIHALVTEDKNLASISDMYSNIAFLFCPSGAVYSIAAQSLQAWAHDMHIEDFHSFFKNLSPIRIIPNYEEIVEKAYRSIDILISV